MAEWQLMIQVSSLCGKFEVGCREAKMRRGGGGRPKRERGEGLGREEPVGCRRGLLEMGDGKAPNRGTEWGFGLVWELWGLNTQKSNRLKKIKNIVYGIRQ